MKGSKSSIDGNEVGSIPTLDTLTDSEALVGQLRAKITELELSGEFLMAEKEQLEVIPIIKS